jgi:hypothetical protein
MNWQTHVPNIFGIGFNVTFIRFLHFFYTSTRVVIRVIITKINDNRFYDTSVFSVFFAVFFFNFDHMFLILILKVAIDATGPRVHSVNFQRNKAFVGLSDRRTIGLSDYRTVGL